MAKQIGYKKKLMNVSELKASGIERLHERVVLLVEVFEDADFRSDISGDDFAMSVALDKYVDDCALSFLELRSVLQAFPAAAEWQQASLRQLYADAVAKSAPAPSAGDAPKRERRAVTVKQFEQVETELKDATCRANTLVDEITELRAENRRLIAENARLEGRISELERSRSRDLSATAR